MKCDKKKFNASKSAQHKAKHILLSLLPHHYFKIDAAISVNFCSVMNHFIFYAVVKYLFDQKKCFLKIIILWSYDICLEWQ